MKVTNIDKGPRGIRNGSGVVVMLEPTQSVELEALADGEDEGEWFHFGDDKPVSLSGKNKAELLAIAEAEGVEIEDGATNDDIKAAIELHREG